LLALLGVVGQWHAATTVEAQTPSPVVVALAGPDSAVVAGQPTTFGYSAGTIDPGGIIRSVVIVYGDGSPAQLLFSFDPNNPQKQPEGAVNHTYARAGAYAAAIQATDVKGNKGQDQAQISVVAQAGAVPVAILPAPLTFQACYDAFGSVFDIPTTQSCSQSGLFASKPTTVLVASPVINGLQTCSDGISTFQVPLGQPCGTTIVTVPVIPASVGVIPINSPGVLAPSCFDAFSCGGSVVGLSNPGCFDAFSCGGQPVSSGPINFNGPVNVNVTPQNPNAGSNNNPNNNFNLPSQFGPSSPFVDPNQFNSPSTFGPGPSPFVDPNQFNGPSTFGSSPSTFGPSSDPFGPSFNPFGP
jgi:hypothetical protein